MNTDALLDLIIDRAPKLRAVGVRHISHGDVVIDIDPAEPVIIERTHAQLVAEAEHEASDPLDDPATFGRREGTPGFDISDLNDHDDEP